MSPTDTTECRLESLIVAAPTGVPFQTVIRAVDVDFWVCGLIND
jgi:hypothetical protein